MRARIAYMKTMMPMIFTSSRIVHLWGGSSVVSTSSPFVSSFFSVSSLILALSSSGMASTTTDKQNEKKTTSLQTVGVDQADGLESELDANESEAENGVYDQFPLYVRRMEKEYVLALQHGDRQALVLIDAHILASTREHGNVVLCEERSLF